MRDGAGRSGLVGAWLLGAALTGCAGSNQPKVYPDDALVDPAHVRQGQPGDAAPADGVYPVDGMVGQINGRPIYADSVFHGDDPIHDSLAALGRRQSRAAFRNDAADQIEARLRAMALDAIVLAEAERDLTENEQRGLSMATGRYREELIRKYGRGSIALTQEQLLEQTGRGLEATLEDYRRSLVVRRYVAKLIDPKINVTRRDIRRHYREHLDEFRPPVKRTLRLVRVDTPEAAADVQRRLEAGEPFAAVAADPLNLNSPSTGGLISGTGDRPLTPALDPINDRVAELEPGGWLGPIPVSGSGRLDGSWFVALESIDVPPQRSLIDVQREIEATLRTQQRQLHTARLYAEFREQVSGAEIQRMTEALVEIAVSRYAAIEEPGTPVPGA